MGLNHPELCRKYPQYPKTSIYGHSNLKIGELKKDGRNENKGRPCKLTDRDERNLVGNLKHLRKTVGNFSSTDI